MLRAPQHRGSCCCAKVHDLFAYAPTPRVSVRASNTHTSRTHTTTLPPHTHTHDLTSLPLQIASPSHRSPTPPYLKDMAASWTSRTVHLRNHTQPDVAKFVYGCNLPAPLAAPAEAWDNMSEPQCRMCAVISE